MLTMLPPPPAFIFGTKAWVHQMMPRTLTSNTERACSGVMSRMEWNFQMPALFTSAEHSGTCSATASTASRSVTSHSKAVPPTSSAVSRAASPDRSRHTTWKPSAVSRSASARPSPCPAPVTTAVGISRRPS